jgi:hypothetical protein
MCKRFEERLQEEDMLHTLCLQGKTSNGVSHHRNANENHTDATVELFRRAISKKRPHD